MIARIIGWYAGIVVFGLPWVGLATDSISSGAGFSVWALHLLAFLGAILWVHDMDTEGAA